MRLYHSPSVSTHGRYRSAAYHGAKSQQTRIAQGEIGRCTVYQPLGKGEGGTKQVARGAALRCCSEGGTCPMAECWYNAQPAVVRNGRPPRCTSVARSWSRYHELVERSARHFNELVRHT